MPLFGCALHEVSATGSTSLNQARNYKYTFLCFWLFLQTYGNIQLLPLLPWTDSPKLYHTCIRFQMFTCPSSNNYVLSHAQCFWHITHSMDCMRGKKK